MAKAGIRSQYDKGTSIFDHLRFGYSCEDSVFSIGRLVHLLMSLQVPETAKWLTSDSLSLIFVKTIVKWSSNAQISGPYTGDKNTGWQNSVISMPLWSISTFHKSENRSSVQMYLDARKAPKDCQYETVDKHPSESSHWASDSTQRRAK